MIKNPAKGVKLRADKEVNAFALTVEQQSEFFEACKGTFYDNMYNVAVNTGLRPGELFALTIADIHMDEGYIDVNKTLVYQKYLEDKARHFMLSHQKPSRVTDTYQ